MIALKSGLKHIVLLSAIINVIAATLFLLYPATAVSQTDHPSFIKWKDWIIPVNEYGNFSIRYPAKNEWDNFLALEKLAQLNKKEPAIYKVLFCLLVKTEMTQVKPDGSIEIQRAEMTPAEMDFCRKSFEMFKRLVFAYSGGNVKIESVERTPDFPFSGEYSKSAYFYVPDYMDFAEGLNIRDFDAIIFYYYPGPVRVSFAHPSAIPAGSFPRDCLENVMSCAIAYEPSMERGGEISVLAKRTLNRWCTSFHIYFYGIEEGNPYYPQAFLGIRNLQKTMTEPELYFLQYVATPNMWHSMSLSPFTRKIIKSSEEHEERVNNEENEGEPRKYFSFDKIRDDIFNKLPELDNAALENITGLKISIITDDEKYCFFDVSNIRGILSNVLQTHDIEDSSLNNEINFARETMALIRYADTDGEQHDLLFVRIDILEPILDLLRFSEDKKELMPRNRILGYIGRLVVIDTFLGELPPNEPGTLNALDSHVSLEVKTKMHRVIKDGKPVISLKVKNVGSEIIDIGTLALSGFPDCKSVKIGNIYNLTAGEIHNFSIDVPTTNMKSGICIFNAILDYQIGDGKFSINKPIVFDIRDAVEASISPENSGLISKPEFNVAVTLRNNTGERERGEVELELPDKWKARPSSYDFDMMGLNETREFKFTITIKNDIPDGDYAVVLSLKIKNRRIKNPAAVCHLRKSFGSILLKYTFDKGIEGDFAVTDGLYKVSLSRETPFAGAACLKVEDEGGSHYGHVGMFSQDNLRPDAGDSGISYTFDTKDYPIIEFYLMHDSPDVNLGIRVILDDNTAGYGIVLNGEWDRSFYEEMHGKSKISCPVINKTLIPSDGKWHRVTIDLDKALDEYLGNMPHRVMKIKIGDTREMDFGWWKDSNKRTFYIDEFSVRKR